MDFTKNKIELEENCFFVLSEFYSDFELKNIIACIENADKDNDSFLKTKDLFAIRQLFNNIPELKAEVLKSKLNNLVLNLFESEYFLTKAIYFDKTSSSNWFVSYHQDLSISVDKKAEVEDYVNWTFKKKQYGVQPPLEILEDSITIRIHLDDTKKENGALRVIAKSHNKGIIRKGSRKLNLENEYICEVPKGGIMIMKPLTLHASNKTTNNKQRRVIHLEFNTKQLASPLGWLELLEITTINI